jgi:hypothetical protein
MQYQELKQFNKPFVVQHYEGHGVVESPHVDLEYVKDFDTLEEAQLFSDNRYPKVTNWDWNHCKVIVNTSTKEGKRLYDIFSKEFEEKLELYKQKELKNPEKYKTVEIEGFGKIILEYNPAFDSTIEEFNGVYKDNYMTLNINK